MNQFPVLNELIMCAKHALPFLPEIETEKLYALRAFHSRSEMNLKRIAVAGSFGSGKSTFINSILALTGDLSQATGISETTAVPTVIRPSSSTSFMRWDHGVLEKAPPAFEAAMLRLRADSVSDLLEYYFSSEMEFVREVELDEVFHGIEYLDLPGLLGIAGRRYDQAIRAGIWGSDGLVYVVAGQPGFQESDRQFAERDLPEGMPVLLLVTHLGEGSAEEDAQVLAKIAESAGAAFKERLRGVCATRYDNGKKSYEWDMLEQRRLFIFQSAIEPMLLYDRCKEAAYSIVQKICAIEQLPQETKSRLLNQCPVPLSYVEVELANARAILNRSNIDARKILALLKRYAFDNHMKKICVWRLGYPQSMPEFAFLLYLLSRQEKMRRMYDLDAPRKCIEIAISHDFVPAISEYIHRARSLGVCQEKRESLIERLLDSDGIWKLEAMVQRGDNLCEKGLEKNYRNALLNWYAKAGLKGYGSGYASIVKLQKIVSQKRCGPVYDDELKRIDPDLYNNQATMHKAKNARIPYSGGWS